MTFAQVLNDYILPSGLGLAAITYFGTQLKGYRITKEAIRTKRLTVINKLLVDFTKANTVFESLRIDAELNGYFAFKNINTIRPMVERLKLITSDDLEVFEDSDELRDNIIDIGDFLSSLFVDVDNLENIAQGQVNADKDAKNKLDNEVKALRNQIIPYGFQITPYLEIVNPSGKNGDKKFNSIMSALSEIKQAHQNSLTSSTSMMQLLKDRRLFYCLKLLDAQERLRKLVDLLRVAQRKYSKLNLFIKLLNTVAL